MIDHKFWCERALKAVFSMWDLQGHHAWRTSSDIDGKDFFPTATFHAICAFGECEILDAGTRYDDRNKAIRTSHLNIQGVSGYSMGVEMLHSLLALGTARKRPKAVRWVKKLIAISSNTGGNAPLPPKGALLMAGLFQSARILVSKGVLDNGSGQHSCASADRTKLAAGLKYAMSQVVAMLRVRKGVSAGNLATDSELIENRETSPYLLFHIALCLIERDRLIQQFGLPDDGFSAQASQMKEIMLRYFTRQTERLMARRNAPKDPQHDPTSLCFSVRGLALLDSSIRRTPFFRACLQAVVESQTSDGRWPEGTSVSVSPSGDTLQQPSVDVALRLAQSVFEPRALVELDVGRAEMIKGAMEAISRAAEYLATTFRDQGRFSGWVSDRVRHPNFAEMWVTALAAQFFWQAWLCTKVCDRVETLSKYNVASVVTRSAEEKIVAKWQLEVVEPDAVTKPADLIINKVLRPIENQLRTGAYFLRPASEGVSYIVFGPPGSGKTFFVKAVAKALGWPVLILNPGHFIRRGLESIEAISSEIFGDLMRLDHVIVFFDECDELFRDRSEQDAGSRNILSFATASMLPKLQDLHDAQQVVFFLGTNYLRNVDAAIRRPGRFDHILLFDRPDRSARKTLLTKFSKSKWSPTQMDKQVAETAGWTIQEIKRYAEAKNAGGSFNESVSIEDYLDWCKHGNEELASSRFSESQKKNISARWGQLPGATPVVKP